MTASVDAGTPALSIDGRVATITLRRPRQANRLGLDDLDTLQGHLARVDAVQEVLVLRLVATGRHFCSGFDLGSGGVAGVDAPARFEALAAALEQARPVTIAAIQGGVYGGATDLALACDLRLGTRACEMFVPAARLGLHFYRGGLERYVGRLGLSAAKRVLLACETLDAQEMHRIGFLDRLCDGPDALDEALERLTSDLAAMAPLALLAMKRHLDAIARGSLDADALEADIRRTLQSDDLREGQAAWAAKRPPRFHGR
jgi:enoyl-CoA hydratase/carnithine racemase